MLPQNGQTTYAMQWFVRSHSDGGRNCVETYVASHETYVASPETYVAYPETYVASHAGVEHAAPVEATAARLWGGVRTQATHINV
jgi:hypothetical protein